VLEQTSSEVKQSFIDTDHKSLSLRRQCELLHVNRSSLYYKPKGEDKQELSLLNEIRDIWIRYPFYGYRRISWVLRQKGFKVNHKRVQRLMKLGGINAIYPGPNTSRRNKQHAVHPYLLKGMTITQPNQAWMVDITYLRMDKGFVYLVALIDVYSRFIVDWRISTTLETSFCMEALESALHKGKPSIVNTDQGCQFTSEEWVSFLKNNEIQISMTGKGRCLDNVYIERFWRSLKREKFYLFEYGSIRELKKDIAEYMDFYNNDRPHQSLNNRIPATLYFNEAPSAVVGF
jgi:putative transposase